MHPLTEGVTVVVTPSARWVGLAVRRGACLDQLVDELAQPHSGPGGMATPRRVDRQRYVARMTRARTAAVAVALLLTLAACSNEDRSTTASSPSSPPAPATSSAAPATTAPAPIADEATIRQVCNEVVGLGNGTDFNPDANLAAGKRAELIVDPAFSQAGRELVKAAGAAAAAPGPDTNSDILKAQLEFLDACGDKYGDGPW